jgi:hypothetical protein
MRRALAFVLVHEHDEFRSTMNFRVQFLDRSGSVLAEWSAYALDVAGAITLTEGAHWPDGAGRMRILDADGRVVHERARANGR